MNLDELERKVDQVTTDLERKVEELGKRLEERFTRAQPETSESKPREKRDTPIWGIALVVVGFVILADHFDWFHFDVPMIPALMILLGLFLILDHR